MIVLTGGAGFIGSNLLKRLNAEGECDILIVDNLRSPDKYRNLVSARFRDYIDKDDFLKLLEACKLGRTVTGILHQGACTDTLEQDGEYMLRNNYDYSKALLHFALDQNIPFVYASSAAVYGHAEVASETEANEWPLNIYGYSKLLFDRYIRQMSPKAKNTVVGLRYFNAYGNGEAHKGRMASMAYQLYNQVKETGIARLFGAIGKYGPGEQARDFVYVKDLVDVNVHFLQKGGTQAVVNVGTGVSRTWNELGAAVIKGAGRGKIEYVDFPESLRDKYQFNTRADLRKLRSLGYEGEFHSLEAGMKDYLSTIEGESAPFRSEAI